MCASLLAVVFRGLTPSTHEQISGEANGVCLPLYCPNNSKKIGRCTHRHFCCKW
uniref:Beta-defensin-like domain-containing protein n=1 Tax=Podarcis muralis TaxID=64176 RepID=A0A670K3R3_PODMU